MSGFVFMLAGGVISWSSKKQPLVALSSTEAKYIAGAHAAKEAIWLQDLVSKIWKDKATDAPITLYIDNQSAIAIAKNPEFYDHTKHIKVRHHFLCQQFKSKAIVLKYLPTNNQVADVLTKGLDARSINASQLAWDYTVRAEGACWKRSLARHKSSQLLWSHAT
jgi:hypothetical protein